MQPNCKHKERSRILVPCPGTRELIRWTGLVFCLISLTAPSIGILAAASENPSPPAPAGAAPAEDERIRGKLIELTKQLNSLDSWLSEADQQRAQLLADIREKDHAVAEAADAVAASDTVLATIETQLAALQDDRYEYRIKQSREAQRIGKHVAAAYRLRGEGFFKLLLDQRDPAKAERLLVYHRYLINARIDAYESFRRASAQLGRNTRALAERRVAARRERQRLIRHREELESTRTQRQGLIAALERDVEDRVSQREALSRDQKQLQALIAELGKQISNLDGTGFAALRGSLPWPMRGQVAHRFGDPRADGRMRWQGLRLDADAGSPVTAISRGRVVFADWVRGFGLLTILDHGDGYMTLYGHADRLLKRRGDLVESGEVIAHAGQSGGHKTSGVYFEIRRDGNATDPLPWLVGGI